LAIRSEGHLVGSDNDVTAPRVSVVMAAYNAEAHLSAAIDSILRQSFTDFEFIIIDDGSTDRTAEIIAAYGDPRIKTIRNPGNLGLIRSLNRGLDAAGGTYVARMDADDEALPERFERQVGFLDAHPEIGLCGTAIETFGVRTERWALICEPARVKCQLLFDPGLSHPTAMFRRSLVVQHGLRYDERYLHAEDYALWVRFADVAGIANLPDVLLRYRLHVQSVSHANRQVQQQTAERIRREQLAKLGIAASDRDMVVHTTLMRGAPHTLALDVGEAEEWLVRLLHGNRQHGYLDQDVLSAVLYEIWFKLCRAHRARLRSAAGRFLRSPLAAGMPLPNRLADAARLLLQRA
jgi:glycosyltransferase involved in cell wall biosynthesis